MMMMMMKLNTCWNNQREVRLDVRDDKRLMCEYRIEPLNSDRDALKQECISRASPVAALNRRPTLVRKFRDQGDIAPRVSSKKKDGKLCDANRGMTCGMEVRLNEHTDHCDVPCHGLHLAKELA